MQNEELKEYLLEINNLLCEIGESLDEEELHHASYFLGRAVEKTMAFCKKINLDNEKD